MTWTWEAHVSQVSRQHAKCTAAPTGEGWYSPTDCSTGPCPLDQVGGHGDHEAFKCVIKGILLPENAYCLMLQQSGHKQEIQELRRYYKTNMPFRWDHNI